MNKAGEGSGSRTKKKGKEKGKEGHRNNKRRGEYKKIKPGGGGGEKQHTRERATQIVGE